MAEIGTAIAAATLASTYNVWGKVATYTPPSGPAVPNIRVLFDQADRSVDVGESRPVMQGGVLLVRKSEVAEPVRNGTFTIGAQTYKILDDPQTPEEDTYRLQWRMTVR